MKLFRNLNLWAAIAFSSTHIPAAHAVAWYSCLGTCHVGENDEGGWVGGFDSHANITTATQALDRLIKRCDEDGGYVREITCSSIDRLGNRTPYCAGYDPAEAYERCADFSN